MRPDPVPRGAGGEDSGDRPPDLPPSTPRTMLSPPQSINCLIWAGSRPGCRGARPRIPAAGRLAGRALRVWTGLMFKPSVTALRPRRINKGLSCRHPGERARGGRPPGPEGSGPGQGPQMFVLNKYLQSQDPASSRRPPSGDQLVLSLRGLPGGLVLPDPPCGRTEPRLHSPVGGRPGGRGASRTGPWGLGRGFRTGS